MHTRSLPVLTFVSVLLIALTGCPTDAPEPPPNDVEAVDQAQVEAFQSEMRDRLDRAESDIARVEGREVEDAPDRAENLRDDHRDVEQLLEMPETESYSQWHDWRESVHSDVTSLEASIDAALIETATDLAAVETEARERLADIRALIQEVADPDDRSDLQEQADDVEMDIAEVGEATEDDLESVRSDIASSVESLRNSVADAQMYEEPETDDNRVDLTAVDDDDASDSDDDYDAN